MNSLKRKIQALKNKRKKYINWGHHQHTNIYTNIRTYIEEKNNKRNMRTNIFLYETE